MLEIENADDGMSLPNLSDRDLAIGAFRYFRNSVMYELNALIEHYLQICSASETALLSSNANLKKSRKDSVNLIFEKYSINIETLPGYSEVKSLYSTVNALKHRGGYHFLDFSKGIPEVKMVDNEISSLIELKNGSFKFLNALVDLVLLAKNK